MNSSLKFKIRNYQSEDYEVVRRIFAAGVRENFWPALKRSWNGESPKTSMFHLTILAIIFSSSNSLTTAVALFVVYQLLLVSFLHYFYYGYAT
jgi:hypothetical protein